MLTPHKNEAFYLMEVLEMIRRNGCMKTATQQKGLTLLEILIALTIVGIISMIAYPSYSQYVYKGHRHQAMTDLIKIQLELENHYDTNYQWNHIISGSQCSLCETSSDRYHFTVTSAGGYTIVATPQSAKGQSNDQCGSLTLKANGKKLPEACW